MKKRNYPLWIGGILFLAFLFTLLGWGRINDPHRGEKREWRKAEVGCLPSHANAVTHIHPELVIRVDGEEETIPEKIGDVPGCMAEVHTHDADGVIHVESAEAGKEFALGQFFTVWGKPIEKAGYGLKVSVDGAEITENPARIPLKDKERIVFDYQRDETPILQQEETPSETPSE